MKSSSWVIVRLSDGKAVLETRDKAKADLVNRKKYKVVPIVEYLAGLNKPL